MPAPFGQHCRSLGCLVVRRRRSARTSCCSPGCLRRIVVTAYVGAVWPALLQPWLPRCSLAPIDLLGCDHGRADVHHDVETASRTPLGVRAAEEEYHRRGSGEMLDDIALPVFAFGYRYDS